MIMLRKKVQYFKSLYCIGLVCILAGCGRPAGYPEAWAAPDKGWFSRLDGCPDIRGQYNGANENLVASLIGMDSIRRRERFVEQRVEVRQPEDGSWIEFEFSINETGVEQLALGGVGRIIDGAYRKIRYLRNHDYYCRDGLLVRDGVEKKHVYIGKDGDKGLIVGEEAVVKNSIGWGDSPSLDLPDSLRTRWLRYPHRDPAGNALFLQQGHVQLSRADWLNRDSVPVYIYSFAVSPVCIRLQYQYNPKHFTEAFVASPSDLCPKPWGELRIGASKIVQMEFPEYPDSVDSYHLQIRPANASIGKEASLVITDARRLPIKNDAPALKLTASDMRVP